MYIFTRKANVLQLFLIIMRSLVKIQTSLRYHDRIYPETS